MKYLSLFLIFLFISCQQENKNSFKKEKHIASKLDSLNNSTEVEEFIHTIDSNYQGFILLPIKDTSTPYQSKVDSLAKALAVKHKINNSFYKEDFDNNGYIDILALGNHSQSQFDAFVILNYGIRYKIKSLLKNRMMPVVPQIKNDNGLPLIVIHQAKFNFDSYPLKLSSVSTPILFYNDEFIEHNAKPHEYNIEKIEFVSGPCFGTCPMFQIIIDKNHTAYFIAQHFNFSEKPEDYRNEEGVFKTSMETKEFEKITELLNYLDFVNLENNYSVTYTDAPSATLKITYNGGKVKTIHDYGKTGTYGLKAIYKIFEDLRFNQDWKPAKEPEGIRIDNF